MKTLQQLYNGFFLDTTCANAQISNCKKFLRVAPIKKVNMYNEIEIEKDNFAFTEKNINGEIEYFHGLKNFLWIEKTNFPPIFIFDNHNHAPIFRYHSVKEGKSNSPILIHIDQHSDCWENQESLELHKYEYNLEKVFQFYNKKCNVGNFIPPSLKSGIISDQTQIRSITALKNLEIKKNQKFILDIDLDFCLSGINRNNINKEALRILKKIFNNYRNFALCTTISTSPYFLNQKVAINIVNDLLIE